MTEIRESSSVSAA
jgi:hypothetical protein